MHVYIEVNVTESIFGNIQNIFNVGAASYNSRSHMKSMEGPYCDNSLV